MFGVQKTLWTRIHAFIELVAVVAAFVFAAMASNLLGKDLFVLSDFVGILQIPVLLALIAYAAVFGSEPDLYSCDTLKYKAMVRKLVGVTLRGGGVFLGLLFLFGQIHIGRTTFVLQIAFLFALLILERTLVRTIITRRQSKGEIQRNVLIVGTGTVARDFLDDTMNHPEWGARVVGFLDWGERSLLWSYREVPRIGTIDNLSEIVLNRQVDCVVFAVRRSELNRVEQPIKVCDEMGTPAMLLADFFVSRIATMRIAELGGRPVVMYSPTPNREFGILAKDIFDRVSALLGMVAILPLLLATALAIKLEDGGPILFRQMRCGLNGRRFLLFKFRSMVIDAEALQATLMAKNEVKGSAFKLTHDPRVTRVGRFLRKSSIDELPQLWNVICGHMSLVGPRPPLPSEVSHFDVWQRRKLSMKPGITGLWQVGGRSEIDFEEWMRMDLQYIDEWSLGLDAKILLKTIPAVISGHGAK